MTYRSSHLGRRFVSSLALLLAVATAGTWVAAQEEEAPAAKPAASVKRLPPHYSKVVTSEQRTKIYAIQQEYAARIQVLQQQLDDLTSERDAQVREVLTPDQQRLVDELIALAKQQRDARRAQENASTRPASPESAGN